MHDDSPLNLFSSDKKNIGSACESIADECETEDENFLYQELQLQSLQAFILILTFVMKHHLTREALITPTALPPKQKSSNRFEFVS